VREKRAKISLWPVHHQESGKAVHSPPQAEEGKNCPSPLSLTLDPLPLEIGRRREVFLHFFPLRKLKIPFLAELETEAGSLFPLLR